MQVPLEDVNAVVIHGDQLKGMTDEDLKFVLSHYRVSRRVRRLF